MATYLELELLASDTTFQKRILYALKQKGFSLITSGNKDKDLITSLYNESTKWPVLLFSNYVVSHPLVFSAGDAITDSNLQIAVNAVFDYLTN